VIGQRIDLDLNETLFAELSFSQGDMVRKSRHSEHSPYGVDNFLFEIERFSFDSQRISAVYHGTGQLG
jgi:hypothetical protein